MVFQVYMIKKDQDDQHRLRQSQWDKLSKDLRKHPKEFGYIQNLWDGKLPAHHLNSHYGV